MFGRFNKIIKTTLLNLIETYYVLFCVAWSIFLFSIVSVSIITFGNYMGVLIK